MKKKVSRQYAEKHQILNPKIEIPIFKRNWFGIWDFFWGYIYGKEFAK
jgi:hypothetical protein